LPAPERDSFVLKQSSLSSQRKIVSKAQINRTYWQERGGQGRGRRIPQEKSFYYYSLSDVIRDEIRSRGQPTREVLIQVGNELRQNTARTFSLNASFRRSKTTSITSSIPSEILRRWMLSRGEALN
jgi:hypothetical protein